MFDVNRRHFELRKNFKAYGVEDRSRYKYQGDLFNIYSNKNNEFIFKYGFVNETIPEAFCDQNLKSLTNKNLNISSDKIKNLYYYLFEEELSKVKLDRLSVSTNLQVEIISNLLKNQKAILEFGPGNGLVAPFFLSKYKKPIVYILVEAIPQLYVLQQNVLKYFSLTENYFNYCSSIKNFNKLQKSSNKSIVLHIQAWQLSELLMKPELIIANNFLDQITTNDFNEYYSYIKNSLTEKAMISIWGGIEKGGVKDLYLFGYGTYHSHDILEKFQKDFYLKEFKKIGSEFFCLFENIPKKKNIKKKNILELEKELIKDCIHDIDYLWIDDNSNYLNEYHDLFKETKLQSYSTSVSTSPLPLNIKRNHIKTLRIKPRKKFLIFSYRWSGIKNFFIENKWKVNIQKLTDRIYIMEILK